MALAGGHRAPPRVDQRPPAVLEQALGGHGGAVDRGPAERLHGVRRQPGHLHRVSLGAQAASAGVSASPSPANATAISTEATTSLGRCHSSTTVASPTAATAGRARTTARRRRTRGTASDQGRREAGDRRDVPAGERVEGGLVEQRGPVEDRLEHLRGQHRPAGHPSHREGAADAVHEAGEGHRDRVASSRSGTRTEVAQQRLGPPGVPAAAAEPGHEPVVDVLARGGPHREQVDGGDAERRPPAPYPTPPARSSRPGARVRRVLGTGCRWRS